MTRGVVWRGRCLLGRNRTVSRVRLWKHWQRGHTRLLAHAARWRAAANHWAREGIS